MTPRERLRLRVVERALAKELDRHMRAEGEAVALTAVSRLVGRAAVLIGAPRDGFLKTMGYAYDAAVADEAAEAEVIQ